MNDTTSINVDMPVGIRHIPGHIRYIHGIAAKGMAVLYKPEEHTAVVQIIPGDTWREPALKGVTAVLLGYEAPNGPIAWDEED